MRTLAGLVLIAVAVLASGWVNPNVSGFFQPSGGGGGGGTAFTPLTTYYMSPTGSDAQSGLAPGTAWATPNHAVHCGDVIIAAAGTYSSGQFNNKFHSVSNCPSTSGGIDGAGGIYAAIVLCAGPDVTSCNITTNGVYVQQSNWAIEGFQVSLAGGGTTWGATCSTGSPCNTAGTTTAYIAFINDIGLNSGEGFAPNDTGSTHGSAGQGVDEFACVGCLAWNIDQSSLAVSNIDSAGPANFDSLTGTHYFFAGSFACCGRGAGPSDVQGFIFDTWDAHTYTGQGVMLNNIAWNNGGYGFALFGQGISPGASTVYLVNNTSYGNMQQALSNASGAGGVGDINLQNPQGTNYVYNNIFQSIFANMGGNSSYHTAYASLIGGIYTLTVGGTGNENVFKGVATSCAPGAGHCDPGNNVAVYNTTFASAYGANFYQDPVFKSTADLMTNHVASFNCAGFVSTTACMGFNGSTVAANSVIDDLTATGANTSGKGYQLPGACVTSGNFHDLFPTWLKGLVYLTWNGSAVTMNNGMLTKPCGL